MAYCKQEPCRTLPPAALFIHHHIAPSAPVYTCFYILVLHYSTNHVWCLCNVDQPQDAVVQPRVFYKFRLPSYKSCRLTHIMADLPHLCVNVVRLQFHPSVGPATRKCNGPSQHMPQVPGDSHSSCTLRLLTYGSGENGGRSARLLCASFETDAGSSIELPVVGGYICGVCA